MRGTTAHSLWRKAMKTNLNTTIVADKYGIPAQYVYIDSEQRMSTANATLLRHPRTTGLAQEWRLYLSPIDPSIQR